MRIKNGHVIDPTGRSGLFDIVIEDGIIAGIYPRGESGGEGPFIDAGGCYVLPGLIDLHCHLREPGFEYKETIASGAEAATRGGFTRVCCMANTMPVNDDPAITGYILSKAAAAGFCRVHPIGAVSKGLEGARLAEIGEQVAAGCVAFSDDGKAVANPQLMRLALQYTSMFNAPITEHCEDKSLVGDGVMNEGRNSTIKGLKGIPRSAEEVHIARNVLLCEAEGGRLHISHVSTRAGVRIIREAKSRGVSVTAETCPHYFSLTDDAVGDYDTFAKVNPPLRTQDDIDAIIEGLADGTIDAIATDHAPHHRDDKAVEFDKAAHGISGFETAFSIAYTHLVKAEKLSMEELTALFTSKPAKVFGLPGGTLGVGGIADIVLFNPAEEWVVKPEQFVSKGKNTPFGGHRVTGKVVSTIQEGKLLFSFDR